ncbi:unnamed protein product [Darwinula stevensoni]|uniref:Uncharacterized protein n=1 Tax=Darwinula stevensoni TaxID=69355 RepID=A0A7R8XDW0_9CRUS|nr:unnamed protein product [Darwinula stevensoni]CAG0888985.1 unnamed protein product [Darwinula stevensoni]
MTTCINDTREALRWGVYPRSVCAATERSRYAHWLNVTAAALHSRASWRFRWTMIMIWTGGLVFEVEEEDTEEELAEVLRISKTQRMEMEEKKRHAAVHGNVLETC